MAAIQNVSAITPEIMAEYLHEDYATLTDIQRIMIATMIDIAKSYITSQTGIPDTSYSEDAINCYQEFVYVVFVLVSDMWDNGSLYVDNKTVNRTVDSILGEHRRNLI